MALDLAINAARAIEFIVSMYGRHAAIRRNYDA